LGALNFIHFAKIQSLCNRRNRNRGTSVLQRALKDANPPLFYNPKMESFRIPARSRRQALDWSLVLISQGIEATIDHLDEKDWNLLVTGDDYENAIKFIKQYRLENQRSSWRRTAFRPGILFDWAALAWALLAVCFYWMDSTIHLGDRGVMDNIAVFHGQWWRLFTAVWLHADLAHLGANVSIGFLLLGLAMGRLGAGTALLAAYLAGAGGNLLVCLVSQSTLHRSLGASGLVMGTLGLLAIQSLDLLRYNLAAWKYILSGVVAGVMLFVLLGVAPGSDVLAHAGGFISGLVLGGIAVLVPSLSRPRANFISSILFIVAVIVPWWCAR
jgi:membrane associated rhomboid family serine protease